MTTCDLMERLADLNGWRLVGCSESELHDTPGIGPVRSIVGRFEDVRTSRIVVHLRLPVLPGEDLSVAERHVEDLERLHASLLDQCRGGEANVAAGRILEARARVESMRAGMAREVAS
jgi:hypothetical protein